MRQARAQDIRIRNEAAELRRVSQWLEERCADWDLPPPLVFDLDLCAQEVVTNIIDHAYSDQGLHHIDLSFSIDDGFVELVIEDNGQPFDPLRRPTTASGVSLEDVKIGGLGIPLVRSLMSDCSYARRGGHNVLTLRLAIPPSPTGASSP
jgi:anti-sigma regulatory factor (Ser/Thr protein kinase)